MLGMNRQITLCLYQCKKIIISRISQSNPPNPGGHMQLLLLLLWFDDWEIVIDWDGTDAVEL